MSKTKTEILAAALVLFNKRGIANVSMRDIAEATSISPGNLTYHFKKREQIIESLYNQFVAEADGKFTGLDRAKTDLALILKLTESMTESRIRYRFIMQDLLQLMSENKKIRTHYRKTLKRRKGQMIVLLNLLVQKGILRKPRLMNEYEFFYDRIQILGSFWIASAGIDGKQIDDKLVNQSHKMIIQSIYPYLTSKGLKDWERLT